MATCLGGMNFGGSIRCSDRRLASSTVGCTARKGPGARSMQKPIQLFPSSVAPICAAFMKTTRCSRLHGDSGTMIPRKKVCGCSDLARPRRPSETTAPAAGWPNAARSARDRGRGQRASCGGYCPRPRGLQQGSSHTSVISAKCAQHLPPGGLNSPEFLRRLLRYL